MNDTPSPSLPAADLQHGPSVPNDTGAPSPLPDAADPAGFSSEGQGDAGEYFNHEYDFGDLSRLSDSDHELVGQWGEYFSRNEIPAPKVERFMRSLLTLPEGAVALPHGYRIPDSFGLTAAQKAWVQPLLGLAHQAGWTEQEAWAGLRGIVDGAAAARKKAARGQIARPDWSSQQRQPQAGGDVARQIAEIEHVMRTDRRRYNRDEAMQARYRELLRAKQ